MGRSSPWGAGARPTLGMAPNSAARGNDVWTHVCMRVCACVRACALMCVSGCSLNTQTQILIPFYAETMDHKPPEIKPETRPASSPAPLAPATWTHRVVFTPGSSQSKEKYNRIVECFFCKTPDHYSLVKSLFSPIPPIQIQTDFFSVVLIVW